MKDKAILFGWIAGLLLIVSLLWSFSFQFRSVCLMRVVNKLVMTDNAYAGQTRILAAPLVQPSARGPLGCWYTIAGSDSIFFVFAIMKDGILVPCGAEISKAGKITEMIPLGSHARQVMGQIPQGQLQVYVHRIESVAAAIAGER
ncbi:MAG: hypothetical protein LBI06_00180 [Treponema sp.]|jgi:hypothetical protein|nr:hypothetical protein [Treponema sp.]